jgi:hypothetical protein
MKKNFTSTRSLLCVAAIASTLFLQACATSVKASAVSNPAPYEAFSAFGQIELKSTQFKPNYSGDISGLAKIDANIKKDLAASLETWNKSNNNPRKLVIEPVIEELQFKHGAKRVLLGPLAGSSGVLLRLKISDNNGKLIASPEFFQRADAMAAGFVFGVHDNLMLTRVANLASSYVIANYATAVGGPTGADSKALAAK